MRAVDMGEVSPSPASSVKRRRPATLLDFDSARCGDLAAAGPRQHAGRGNIPRPPVSRAGLFSRLGPERLLELAGQFDESRREADVLVERIALIVAGNDLWTPLVRHGGGNFVEGGMEQIGDDGFDRL